MQSSQLHLITLIHFLYLVIFQSSAPTKTDNNIDWGQSLSAMDWNRPVSRFDDELRLDLTMSSVSSDDSEKENNSLTVNTKVDTGNSTQTLVPNTKPTTSSLVQGNTHYIHVIHLDDCGFRFYRSHS